MAMPSHYQKHQGEHELPRASAAPSDHGEEHDPNAYDGEGKYGAVPKEQRSGEVDTTANCRVSSLTVLGLCPTLHHTMRSAVRAGAGWDLGPRICLGMGGAGAEVRSPDVSGLTQWRREEANFMSLTALLTAAARLRQ